jgi:hypothetical protein
MAFAISLSSLCVCSPVRKKAHLRHLRLAISNPLWRFRGQSFPREQQERSLDEVRSPRHAAMASTSTWGRAGPSGVTVLGRPVCRLSIQGA